MLLASDRDRVAERCLGRDDITLRTPGYQELSAQAMQFGGAHCPPGLVQTILDFSQHRECFVGATEQSKRVGIVNSPLIYGGISGLEPGGAFRHQLDTFLDLSNVYEDLAAEHPCVGDPEW